jgi:Fic-DOC domain mobile mystery protein B
MTYGKTPLSADEEADLIPDLTTQEELNEWERQNILAGAVWALDSRRFKRHDPLTESYVRELHRRMFDQTWKWAGVYRATEKNIGVATHRIRDELMKAVGDARYWLDNRTCGNDEVAIRFHHRLVWIHPFANGNGRHARLMADVVLRQLGEPAFTWGSSDIARGGDFRRGYIGALRAADRGDIDPLLAFARS